MRTIVSLLRQHIVGVTAAGALAAMSALSPAMAADIPAGVAAKVGVSGGLSRLWAEPGVRLPVIIEFAMPSLPDKASYASVQDADAAQIAAVHAVQDRILGNTAGIDRASAESALAVKRMDYSPMFGAQVTAAELEAFAANGEVVRINEDSLAKPYLDQALPLIGMPAAYAGGATGSGAVVAILDTGGRRTHEFLSSRVIGAACYSTNNAGQSSTSYCPGGASSSTSIDSAPDCDEVDFQGCGHGTHVSGIAGGFNTNRQSGEPANGVARDGRLITINVFSQFSASQSACGGTPCVLSFTSDQILGLERVLALKNGGTNIAAANMSLGGGQFFSACDGTASQTSIINQLRAANVATVIAAGNSFFNDSVGSPGCISAAITVASSTKSDQISDFSNWGTLIDVVAPGSSILSSTTSGSSNTFYASFNGTSMASPMVAGTWGALHSARPTATVSQIEAALESTGVQLARSGVAGTKPRIRVNLALNALPGAPAPIIVAAVTPVSRATSVGGTVTAFATVINGGTTTATSCSVALPSGAAATFSYRSRDFNTNALGPVNTPVNIAGGNTRQDFLLSFTPTAVQSSNLALVFDCTNTAPATTVAGVNTFLLTAATTAPADLISIAVTATNDGIANVPLGGTGFAALAGNNIGAAATLTATVSAAPIGGSGTLAATLTLCRTSGGACVATPTSSVTFTAASNTIVTFTAFIASNGTAIPFDPANKRLYVHFRQGSTPVGSASVAVRTVAPDTAVAAAQ